MNPARPKTACVVILLLELSLAVAGLWQLGAPSLPHVPLFAFWLVVYRHPNVTVWRAPSTVIAASMFTAAMTYLSARMLNAWTPLHCAPSLASAALFLTIPGFGHLSPWIWGSLRHRKPLDFPHRGRVLFQVKAALAATPGCPWRLAKEGEPSVGPLSVPTHTPHDYQSRIVVPSGDLRLFREIPNGGMSGAVKHTIDFGMALLMFVPSLLLFLPLAALVRLRMGSPVIYQQVRLTKGGAHFSIHKLRSMGNDAEPGDIPVWPAEHDPRITPLGRTLRRFWLDEIPQVADVLRGPLSLVGPRPERPHFVEEFSRDMPNYPMRHQVRSGVTGLAQVSGYVGNTSLQRRLHLDLRYIRRWSPALDLSLMLATVTRVLRRPPIESGEPVSACEERSPSPLKRH